jgi:hypothetical protein
LVFQGRKEPTMLAQDDDLTTRDLVRMLNVPLDAIPSVVREAGRLLAARTAAAAAVDDASAARER